MNEEDQKVWDMFFGEVAGWTVHPGFNRENARQPTLEECAEMADAMMILRQKRRDQWPPQ